MTTFNGYYLQQNEQTIVNIVAASRGRFDHHSLNIDEITLLQFIYFHLFKNTFLHNQNVPLNIRSIFDKQLQLGH